MALGLNRSLSFHQLLFYGLVTAIGSGIYYVTSRATGFTDLLPDWIRFLCALLAALITVISYAELIAMFSKAKNKEGALALQNTLPNSRLSTFLEGYLITLNIIACCITVAFAYAGYLNIFFTIPILLMTSLLLLICTIIHISAIKQSIWVNVFLVSVEIAGLIALVLWGLLQQGNSYSLIGPELNGATFGSFLASATLSFFVYISCEDIASQAENSTEPKRNFAHAFIWSSLITFMIYLLVIWISMGTVKLDNVLPSMAPLPPLTHAIHPIVGKALGITGLYFSTNIALITFTMVNRLLLSMADEKRLRLFSLSALFKRKAMWFSSLVMFTATCILLPLDSIKLLTNALILGILLVFIITQVFLIIIHYRKLI